MAVLLENMEMPRTCYDCKLRRRNGLELICPVLERSYKIADTQILFVREKDCPLIEVPEPHGRLIDKDALDIYQRAEAAYAEYQEDEDNLYLEGMANGLCEAAKQLSTARTVIHASKEG